MPALPANKAYDLFVSYSQSDRPVVEGFAEALRARRVSLWYDRWEMRPGDTLRERISDGITQARNFMVLLTPASLASDWVKYELNVGMLEEIEGSKLRVIPVLASGITLRDIPADLRVKYCLNISTVEGYCEALDQLVEVTHPERRERRELLRALRAGEGEFRHVAVLREYALPYGDQAIQIAALRGLARHGGADATLMVIERSLDMWGLSALKTANKILARRGADGILGLAATFFGDHRFFNEKLEVFAATEPALADVRAAYLSAPFEQHLPQVAEALFATDNRDIQTGAVLSAHYLGRPLGIPLPSPDLVASAQDRAESRIPGLLRVLQRPRRHPY